jgi:hypothetical protein
MRHAKWIKAQDLARWADTNEAKAILPELVRRLIHATSARGDMERIDFAGGEETQRPGFDGVTKCKTGHALVPADIAYWELSGQADVKRKLDDDYEKRKAVRVPGDFSTVSYIGVTLRDFQQKQAWAAQRTGEKLWKEVRVYDSSDLEQWLELAPGVALWLTRYVLKQPEGMTDLSTHWANLQSRLKTPLPPEALLTSRQATAKHLDAWIGGAAEVLTMHGPTPQEVVDVFAAWVQQCPQPAQDAILSRTIIVDSPDAWRQLADSSYPLILVCSDRLDITDNLISEARRKGHHVLRPVSTIRSQDGIKQLERIDRHELVKVLEKAGIEEAQAVTLAQQCGGHFSVLKRRYAAFPVDEIPAWSKSPAAEQLAPLLLLGAWVDANTADQTIVTTASGLSYPDARNAVNRWRNQPDSPVRWANGVWEFVSPIDAWSFLHPALAPDQLARWEELCIGVLKIDDPRLDLPREERWMASIHKKIFLHSYELRQGLAQSLALLGTQAAADLSDPFPLQERVNRVVRSILPAASTWKRWASLDSLLPILAEAAPDAILETLEAGVAGDTPEIAKLFAEESDAFTGRAEHTGLLWALERLCWSPQYLTRATLVLGKLAEHDPGGKWANRPRASLRDVFFSWMPHTSATVTERNEILETLLMRRPKAGWQLVLDLLPEAHESIMVHSPPQWRYWAEGWKREISRRDYEATVAHLVDLVLRGAEAVTSRWPDLLDSMPSLRGSYFEKGLRALEALTPEKLDEPTRAALWEKVRDLVAKHRYFTTADWALPPQFVQRFEQVRDRMQPADIVTRSVPIFSHDFTAEGHSELDWSEQERLRRIRRLNALTAIIEQRGFEGVKMLVRASRDAWSIGILIAQEFGGRFDADILPGFLLSTEQNEAKFAETYVGVMAHRDRAWAEKFNRSGWSDLQSGVFLSRLPFDRAAWDFIAGLSPEIQAAYWKHTQGNAADLGDEDLLFGANQLLDAHRVSAALQVISLHRKQGPKLAAAAVLAFLEKVADGSYGNERGQLDSYYLQQLFEQLQKDGTVDHARLAKLEWAYLPLLNEHTLLPHTLHRQLASEPGFFVELLAAIYRKRHDDAPAAPAGEHKLAVARRARELLADWVRLPGTLPDGSIDPAALASWVKFAREESKKIDRIEVCDIQIGQILACSLEDSDGSWPCVAVREVLEGVESAELGRGFSMAVDNNRGIVTKSLHEGGKQERDLAAKFGGLAGRVRTRWPRTAAILQSLAQGYENEAIAEDRRAEADDL